MGENAQEHAGLLEKIRTSVAEVIANEMSSRDEKLDQLAKDIAASEAKHLRAAQDLVKGVREDMESKIAENRREAEARRARHRLGWGGDPEEAGAEGEGDDRRLTLGQSFTRSSAYKDYVSRSTATTTGVVEAQDSARYTRITPRVRAGMRARIATAIAAAQHGRAVVHGETEVGALGDRNFMETVLDPQRPPMLRDVIPSESTTEDTNVYPRETYWHAITSTVTSGPHADDQKDIEVTNTYGFLVGSTVYTGATQEGTPIGVIASINHTTKVITCVANLAAEVADGAELWAKEFTVTPENQVKPCVGSKFESVTCEIGDIASLATLTKKQMRNARNVERIIDTKVRRGLDISEDGVYLKGDSDNNIDGLLSVTGVQTVTWSAMATGARRADAIRQARTKVALGYHLANVLIIHPTDLEFLDTDKSSADEHYILRNAPVSNPLGNGIWGLEIVESSAIPQGTALVMDALVAAYILDREATSVMMSESHGTNFEKNLVTVRAERASMICIPYPAAICKITLDSAP